MLHDRLCDHVSHPEVHLSAVVSAFFLILTVSGVSAQDKAEVSPELDSHEPELLESAHSEEQQVQARKDRAHTLAIQGIVAFKNRDYSSAVAAFEAAESLSHAPSHLYYIGRALEKRGQLIRARTIFQRLVDEELPAGAPLGSSWEQETARSMVADLTARIPRATVNVREAKGSPAVFVDGQRSAWTPENRIIELDPGKHEVVAEDAGEMSHGVTITLQEFSSREVVLRFAREAAGAPLASPLPANLEEIPSMADVRRQRRPLIWGGFALAAAGAVTGSVTGMISWRKTRDVRPDCFNEDKCGPKTHERLDLAQDMALASNISFVVGIFGAGAGLYGLFAPPARVRQRSPRSVLLPDLVVGSDLSAKTISLRWESR